jgi:hypothetical protein
LLKAGQSVVVIAPRKFGKTSLMFEVIRKIKQEKWFTCYVDLFSVPTLLALAERITESVLSNSRQSHPLNKSALSLQNWQKTSHPSMHPSTEKISMWPGISKISSGKVWYSKKIPGISWLTPYLNCGYKKMFCYNILQISLIVLLNLLNRTIY